MNLPQDYGLGSGGPAIPTLGADFDEMNQRESAAQFLELMWQKGFRRRPPRDPRRIFAWSLTEPHDTFGNRCLYEYEKDDVTEDGPHHRDQNRLKAIRYIDYGLPRSAPVPHQRHLYL